MELENVFCKILLCYNLRNNIVNLLLVFFVFLCCMLYLYMYMLCTFSVYLYGE